MKHIEFEEFLWFSKIRFVFCLKIFWKISFEGSRLVEKIVLMMELFVSLIILNSSTIFSKEISSFLRGFSSTLVGSFLIFSIILVLKSFLGALCTEATFGITMNFLKIGLFLGQIPSLWFVWNFSILKILGTLFCWKKYSTKVFSCSEMILFLLKKIFPSLVYVNN